MSETDRERWDRRWSEAAHEDGGEPRWLDPLLAGCGANAPALDVACGAGRVALRLARLGFAVLAVDVSPVALTRVAASAGAAGLRVETRALDLEHDALPRGPFACITCFAYLQRDLFPALRARLAPGGVLACEIATVRNLERHAHPSRRFLLEPGELVRLVEPSPRWLSPSGLRSRADALAARAERLPLEVVYAEEGWQEDRHVARVACRMAR